MMHIMHTVVTELPKNSCYCNIANKNQFLITMKKKLDICKNEYIYNK